MTTTEGSDAARRSRREQVLAHLKEVRAGQVDGPVEKPEDTCWRPDGDATSVCILDFGHVGRCGWDLAPESILGPAHYTFENKVFSRPLRWDDEGACCEECVVARGQSHTVRGIDCCCRHWTPPCERGP